MKNRTLNQWLWKWHFIAGLIAVPFVFVLSVTGTIYLFKDQVEAPHIANVQTVADQPVTSAISYQQQLEIATKALGKAVNEVVVPVSANMATEFAVGRFSHKKSAFVNPYSGEVTGNFNPKDTWMHTVRKLHGELLGGAVGTKIVELVACWTIVLVLTGLYVWFPFKSGNLKGVFTIRFNQGRRTFFRDLHAVTGFWFSLVLLLTLAGGLPWTDVFGGSFKKVQKLTNTGYPATWNGVGLSSEPADKPLTLDAMMDIAKAQKLEGKLTVGLPRNGKGTFSVSNSNFDLGKQKMLRFDQYSGQLVKAHNWEDVGILMRGRMWVMAFHQGQLANWNWWLMFLFSILLAIMSLAAVASYLLRKPEKSWGVPPVPAQFQVGKGVLFLIGLLAIVFPLFGISLLLIWIGKFVQNKRRLQPG